MIESMEVLEVVGRLVLAVALGGVIGWEREAVDRPAGFRTHVLVCVGSATYMMISLRMADYGSDPARIASQVASGMGFLGAGTILRHGNVVRGLTTAASLWTVAAIGLCAGVASQAALTIAVLATIVVFITLRLLSKIEHTLAGGNRVTFTITARDTRDVLPLVQATLHGQGARMVSVRHHGEGEPGPQTMELVVRVPSKLDPALISCELLRLDGVDGVEPK
jgi:putative Mg2+ transporter-C (MgtC) family protein